jgi:hypothetical protein
MRRFAIVLVAGMLLASTAGSVGAVGPAVPGVLPANAHPLGYSLVDLGTAWNRWALAAPFETNPFIAARCEQSSLDPKIWFLPEPYPGGPAAADCRVPHGALLVVSPFFFECSDAEPPPFYGGNETELRTCVEDGFDVLSSVGATLDGKTATDLDDYVLTTRLDTVPANNLLGPNPALSMNRGIFMVIAPLSRGTHTLAMSWEIGSWELQANLTITLSVR